MLGHEIRFKYCRTTDSDNLCKKIRNCWFDKIKIDEFLGQHYSEEQIAELNKPVEHKYVSLFSLIEKAKKNAGKDEN